MTNRGQQDKRQTGKHTDKCIERRTGRQTDINTNMQVHKQTYYPHIKDRLLYRRDIQKVTGMCVALRDVCSS